MPSKISYQTGKMNSISKAKENIILFLSIAGWWWYNSKLPLCFLYFLLFSFYAFRFFGVMFWWLLFQVAWPARAVLFICLAGFPWLPLLAYSAPSFADLPAYLPAAGTALIFRSYLPSSRRCGDDDGDDDYDGDYAIGFLLETQHPQSYNLCSEWWCDLTSPNKSLFVSFHLSCLQFCNYLNTMHYVLFWTWTFESTIEKISASFPDLMKFLSLELFSYL